MKLKKEGGRVPSAPLDPPMRLAKVLSCGWLPLRYLLLEFLTKNVSKSWKISKLSRSVASKFNSVKFSLDDCTDLPGLGQILKILFVESIRDTQAYAPVEANKICKEVCRRRCLYFFALKIKQTRTKFIIDKEF